MSRNEAKSRFDVQEMMERFKKDEIFLMTPSKKQEVLDEYTKAYKNVVEVIENQNELVEAKNQMKTVVVVKA